MKIITMGNKGFSLVELMVAVGIIGSMSAVAVPNYAKFKAKSLQATAQQNLSNIYTLQNLYFTEHDEYGKADEIEFSDNDSKYEYKVGITDQPQSGLANTTTALNGHATEDNIGFKATAKSSGKLAACATEKDHWCVNQDKLLSNQNQTDQAIVGPCLITTGVDFLDGGCK